MSDDKRATQDFLDEHQYSRRGIAKYERIFGHTWVSTGGETTTKEFCLWLKLRPGDKVLDIGCGSGGSAFYMARQYGAHIHGVDLSQNMIHAAEEALSQQDEIIQKRIKFSICDILKTDFPEGSFDVIYSRDALLHIPEKLQLFKRMLPWLKKGGKVLISDYCKGEQHHSQEFQAYLKQRGYALTTVKSYGKILEDAGFKNVEAIDQSSYFTDILTTELKYFEPCKEAFIQDFNKSDYDDIVDGWKVKLVRVENGEQTWAHFRAIR